MRALKDAPTTESVYLRVCAPIVGGGFSPRALLLWLRVGDANGVLPASWSVVQVVSYFLIIVWARKCVLACGLLGAVLVVE